MNRSCSNQWLYSFVYFFLFAAIAALFPFLPLLLQSKGIVASRIGYLLGSYELFSILGLLTIGHFYDRLPSPKATILLIGALCIIQLFLLSRIDNIALIIVVTLCLGFVIKSPASLIDTHYGQVMPPSNSGYGKARLFGSLGFFAAALLIQLTGWVKGDQPITIFKGFALAMSASLLFLLFLPSGIKIHEKKGSLSFIETIKSFPGIYWFGLGIVFLNLLGMTGHYSFFSLMIKHRFGRGDVGGLWAIGPLFEVPLFFYSGWLMRKVGIRKLWMLALVSGIIRMQVYSLSDNLLPLYVVQILHSFTFGFNHLCMVRLITDRIPAKQRGLSMALFSAVGMGLSLFTGGLLGGWILSISDFKVLFQMFSIFPAIGLLLLLFKGKILLNDK